MMFKENEKAILRRTERAMVRAMCSQKVVDKKTEEQINMLGLKETIDRLAKANELPYLPVYKSTFFDQKLT